MTEPTRGVLAILAACTVWGLSPIFYTQLAHVPPLELLSHRTLWSLLFFGGILFIQGRLGQLKQLLAGRRAVLLVGVAALMISANWFLFILSTQIGQVTESSLGYYIFPLVAVALGRVVLGDRLSRAQACAVALAACGVFALIIGVGVVPWVSLALALTFGFYGLIKGRVAAGPVVSVSGEVALLAPLAMIWLWGVHTQGLVPGWSGAMLGALGRMQETTLLLMLSGPITAGPLILFRLCDPPHSPRHGRDRAIRQPDIAVFLRHSRVWRGLQQRSGASLWPDMGGAGNLFGVSLQGRSSRAQGR